LLLRDFYTVLSQSEKETTVVSGIIPERHYHISVRLNPDHEIYAGHFPGNPVVPGVCQVQVICELVSGILGRKVMLSGSDHIKFLNMINPVLMPVLSVDIGLKFLPGDQWDAGATISGNEMVFIKFKGHFKTN
jgi:3-hydroxyacyl-[acyl-carrier-protein] dehydratase